MSFFVCLRKSTLLFPQSSHSVSKNAGTAIFSSFFLLAPLIFSCLGVLLFPSHSQRSPFLMRARIGLRPSFRLSAVSWYLMCLRSHFFLIIYLCARARRCHHMTFVRVGKCNPFCNVPPLSCPLSELLPNVSHSLRLPVVPRSFLALCFHLLAPAFFSCFPRLFFCFLAEKASFSVVY